MIIIGFGANLSGKHGNAEETLCFYAKKLSKSGVNILKSSHIYESAPVPISDQPWYKNAVCVVETHLPPHDLLNLLSDLEKDAGRVRTEQNAPRVLDLDLLAYHDVIMNDDTLKLPHPELHNRAFTLYPMAEISKDWKHPTLNKSVDNMIKNLPTDQKIKKIRGKKLFETLVDKLRNQPSPLIMGIVNATPDSFFDGGEYNKVDQAIAHGKKILKQGADILDIGGESTRPNAKTVSVQEELNRIIPVIEGLKPYAEYISVDTRNSKTMEAAIKAGANMINDVSALTHDPEAMSVVSQSGLPVCLMHMKGTPETMQNAPKYKNVIDEVLAYLENRMRECVLYGIDINNIIVDPGIGFGKVLEHNLIIIKNLHRFQSLGCPLLLGASRKSFIAGIDKNASSPKDRLGGSLATILHALKSNNTQILRVHDVVETVQAVKVYKAILSAEL